MDETTRHEGLTQTEHATAGFSACFLWANEQGVHGMARPEALERDGWVRVRQHPNYPKSWLMRKEAT